MATISERFPVVTETFIRFDNGVVCNLKDMMGGHSCAQFRMGNLSVDASADNLNDDRITRILDLCLSIQAVLEETE